MNFKKKKKNYDVMFIFSTILARRPVFDSEIPLFPESPQTVVPSVVAPSPLPL